MNNTTFRLLLCAVALLFVSGVSAQTALEQRMHDDYSGWKRIVPTHYKGQYAGGMGLFSLACGWDYGRWNRWETDFHVGYLPEKFSDGPHVTFTLKQNYIPWNIRCHERLGIEPFSCGAYINYISGGDYWVSEPSKYGNYYRFASRLRLYLYVGQRVTYYFKPNNSPLKSVCLYYELSSKDLDLISKATNHTLDFDEIFYFSVGVKFGLHL